MRDENEVVMAMDKALALSALLAAENVDGHLIRGWRRRRKLRMAKTKAWKEVNEQVKERLEC